MIATRGTRFLTLDQQAWGCRCPYFIMDWFCLPESITTQLILVGGATVFVKEPPTAKNCGEGTLGKLAATKLLPIPAYSIFLIFRLGCVVWILPLERRFGGQIRRKITAEEDTP